MNRIVYIVPYFGRLRSDFKLWLASCKMNPTINWLIYTDDKENDVLLNKDIPENVMVRYISFEEMRNKIQKYFDLKSNFQHRINYAIIDLHMVRYFTMKFVNMIFGDTAIWI